MQSLLLLLPFAISLGSTIAIISTRCVHGGYSSRSSDIVAAQASHVLPAPRIGGLAIAAALGAIALILDLDPAFQLILISALPIFAIGLKEDVFRDVSARTRYVVAALSAALAVFLLDAWIRDAEPAPLGYMLAIAPVGISVTIFVTASFCHAFNLIDGLNGLCAGTAIIVAVALASVAQQAGEPGLADGLLMLAAAVSGFAAMNFPAGRIFLGDAGAYSLGHILSWCGVALIAWEPAVSVWAILLIFFWPLADTLFAMYRRLRSGTSIDTPDRLHFHQLVMRAIEMVLLGRNRRRQANPMATIALMPFITMPALSGALLWNQDLLSGLALLAYGAGFVGLYQLIRRGAVVRRRRPSALQRVLHSVDSAEDGPAMARSTMGAE